MIAPNSKHPNYDDQLLPPNSDIFKPEFKRDSRGRYFMQLPGYGKWMVGNEPGSKIIAQGSEDERGGPGTDPGSMRTGSLHAETVISIGDNIYLDGGTGCIYVGDYQKRVQPSIDICGEGIKGHVGTDTVFAFFLEKDGDFGTGDFFIGDYGSDNYVLWDDSEGYLYVKGKIYATSGEIGGWDIGTCLKKEYTISAPSKTKIELCAGNPGHIQAAYSPTGSFSLPGDVYMVQITQGSTGDSGGVPIPRMDIYKDGTKRMMLNSDGLYFFDADGTTINNKIELTQATLHDVVIESGAIAATSEPSIQGWSHNIIFSSTDLNTVSWTSGTITLTNGDSFSIVSGNTGNMAVSTYIYLDKGTSETVLQTTITASTAIGSGKIMIAFAKNSTNEAIFQVFGGIGGIKLNGSDLENLTVEANQIAANAIEESKVLTDAITAAKIAVSGLDGTTGDVAANHIVANMLQTNCVTSAKVLANAITASKINVVGLDGTSGRIVVVDSTDADEVTSGINSYASTLITAGKIVISGTTKLSDWRNTTNTTCIEGGKIYTNTITALQINSNTITATQIASNTITASEIASNTITANEIAVNTITASEIATGAINADEIASNAITTVKINANAVTSTKISVTNLAAMSANCGSIRVGGSGNTYGTLSVRDSGGTEVALLNNNAIIVRQNKAFSAESSSSGVYTQFYTSGLNGIIEITNNASGTFGIKDDDSSHYFMKWTNYDISVWKSMLPMVSTIDLGSSTYKWDDVFCNAIKGLYGEIYLDQSGRIQFTNHCDPTGTGSYNLGGASRYWDWVTCNNIDKKTGGGTGWLWLDDGVELQNGKIVSDIEAINNMKLLIQTNKKGEKIKTIDPKTLPKIIFRPARKHNGELYPRDKNDKAYKLDKNKKKIEIYDGEDVFATISLLIGSVKELSSKIKTMEKLIN